MNICETIFLECIMIKGGGLVNLTPTGHTEKEIEVKGNGECLAKKDSKVT